MQMEIIQKLREDKKMLGYLRENSHWYKELNRDPNNYKTFVKVMREKYKLKVSDKIESAVDNIELITSVLNVLG